LKGLRLITFCYFGFKCIEGEMAVDLIGFEMEYGEEKKGAVFDVKVFEEEEVNDINGAAVLLSIGGEDDETD
jgi:hypothetical protein